LDQVPGDYAEWLLDLGLGETVGFAGSELHLRAEAISDHIFLLL
tara:strand:- start:108 stop:239 length:132 start_codon:yes stop_codon:yes gene_type:complete